MPGAADTGAANGLREATLAGMRWIFAARVVAEVTLLGSAVVLARLIGPAEFGRAAIAVIFATLASTIIGGIAGPLLIQRPEIDAAHREASAWIGATVGGALSLATLIGAPHVVRPLFDAGTSELVQISSPSFLIVGLAVAPQAMLQRNLAFRRLSEIEIASTVAGAALSIVLAALHLGGKAIVLGALFGLVISSAWLVYSGGVVAPRWRGRALAEVTRFGIPAALGSVGTLVYGNVDYAIVGSRLGAATLGIYWRAYQLGAEYQGKITVIMQRLAFPVFSRSEGHDQMRRMRLRIMRMHATIVIPLLALMIAVAPELIPFLYGDAWRRAIGPTQILSVAGMAAALLNGIGPLMLAKGKPWQLGAVTWGFVVLYATAIALAVPHGLTAVCLASVGVTLLALVGSSYLLVSRQAGIPLRSLWDEAGPAVVGSALLLGAAWPLASGLHDAGIPAPLAIGAAALVGGPLYLVTIRRLSAGAWEDLLMIRSRVLGLRGRGAGVSPGAAGETTTP